MPLFLQRNPPDIKILLNVLKKWLRKNNTPPLYKIKPAIFYIIVRLHNIGVTIMKLKCASNINLANPKPLWLASLRLRYASAATGLTCTLAKYPNCGCGWRSTISGRRNRRLKPWRCVSATVRWRHSAGRLSGLSVSRQGHCVKPVRPQRRSDRFALQERLKPALLDRGAFGALRARHFNCQR